MKFREEADYNPSYMFNREDFIAFRKEAEELSDKIKGYLKEKKIYLSLSFIEYYSTVLFSIP